MKDFEKFLTDLPKPRVDVPAFRRELGRELAEAGVAPGDGDGDRVFAAAASHTHDKERARSWLERLRDGTSRSLDCGDVCLSLAGGSLFLGRSGQPEGHFE